MTPQRKILVPLVAIAAAVLLAVLGISLNWAAWLTVVLVVACCAVGTLTYLFGRSEPAEVSVPQRLPMIAEPPPPVQLAAVQGVNLASVWSDYEFLFDATVYWRPTGSPTTTPHYRPGARAIDAIIERAAVVAATERPDMAIRLQHRLNDILGMVDHDSSGQFETWADQVRITVPDADVHRLHRLSSIRKDKDLWEHERRFECDRRQYLTDDVLRSTGSALVWWLSKNESDVSKAAELIDTMARLSATARNEPVLPTLGSDGAGQPLGLDFSRFTAARSPVEAVTVLMDAANLPDDPDQRQWFARLVAMALENVGYSEAAAQVRQHFNVTDPEEPAGSADDAWRGAHAWPEDD